MTEQIDTLIVGSHVVTMNATRDVIRHGAVAVRGNRSSTSANNLTLKRCTPPPPRWAVTVSS